MLGGSGDGLVLIVFTHHLMVVVKDVGNEEECLVRADNVPPMLRPILKGSNAAMELQSINLLNYGFDLLQLGKHWEDGVLHGTNEHIFSAGQFLDEAFVGNEMLVF